MNEELSRRRFLKDTALLAGAMAAMQSVDRAVAGPATPAAMPTIRLGHVEVSRLILGTNPFFGYAHQEGDLGRQMKEYYTEARIIAVLDEAAALGVTAVSAPPFPEWMPWHQRLRHTSLTIPLELIFCLTGKATARTRRWRNTTIWSATSSRKRWRYRSLLGARLASRIRGVRTRLP